MNFIKVTTTRENRRRTKLLLRCFIRTIHTPSRRVPAFTILHYHQGSSLVLPLTQHTIVFIVIPRSLLSNVRKKLLSFCTSGANAESPPSILYYFLPSPSDRWSRDFSWKFSIWETDNYRFIDRRIHNEWKPMSRYICITVFKKKKQALMS